MAYVYDPGAVIEALESNDVDGVRRHLEAEGGVDRLNNTNTFEDRKNGRHERTQFGLAVAAGAIDVVRLLLRTSGLATAYESSRDNPDNRDIMWSPLEEACRYKQWDIAILLLDTTGFDFGLGNSLVFACDHGGLATVSRLLALGSVDVNAPMSVPGPPYGDWAALHMAIFNGCADIVDVLLAVQGINANADADGEITVLCMAVKCGRNDVVAKLLAVSDIDVNLANCVGTTPLHSALSRGKTAIANLLLARADIDVNATNKMNSTPLHAAVRAKRPSFVRILLARPETRVNVRAEQNQVTPMTLALRLDKLAHGASDPAILAIIKLLLEHGGIDVTRKDVESLRGLVYLGDEMETRRLLSGAIHVPSARWPSRAWLQN